jgi:hypothetical protein
MKELHVLESQGPELGSPESIGDCLSQAWEVEARMLAIPVERFSPDFWRLETRLLGEFVQKFAQYQVALAFLGDLSAPLERSESFRAFVREARRGRQLWFAQDVDELRRLIGQ